MSAAERAVAKSPVLNMGILQTRRPLDWSW